MDTLSRWSARRSGGRITITGRDETGAEAKVPNVDTIALDDRGLIVATDKDGTTYRLLVGIHGLAEAAL